jgi:predicted outer membrane repeat protein
MSNAAEEQAPALAARLGAGVLAVVLAVAVTGAGGAAAPASAATARVPCSPAALSAAISGAAAGGTVSLTPGCSYVLTSGLPAVTRDLTITGNGATLRRSTAPVTPPFTILPVTGGNLTVSNLNFRGGGGSPSIDGGAIEDTGDGQLTIHGGHFTGNSAGWGGAISSAPAAGLPAPVIRGATFTGNSAAGGGGAILTFSLAGSIAVSNCAFRGNHADDDGGAVWETGSGGGGFSNTVFAGNTAAGDGGALWLSEVYQPSLQQDTFRSNTAGGNGGAIDAAVAPQVIYSNEMGGVDISGGLIAWNRAGGDGGGIYGALATTSDVDNVTIEENKAGDGGGIYGGEDSVFDLSAVVLAGNAATGDGGGLDSDGAPDFSFVGLTGTTVMGNRAAAGGGIYDGPGAYAALGPGSSVTGNRPDNCAPPGTVTGCTG